MEEENKIKQFILVIHVLYSVYQLLTCSMDIFYFSKRINLVSMGIFSGLQDKISRTEKWVKIYLQCLDKYKLNIFLKLSRMPLSQLSHYNYLKLHKIASFFHKCVHTLQCITEYTLLKQNTVGLLRTFLNFLFNKYENQTQGQFCR